MPFIKINYKTIHYADVPPAKNATSTQAHPIILVHGLGSSQNYYYPVIPTLSAAGYRCLVPDTSGSARSRYTYIEQSGASLAADVSAFMDALGVKKAIVAGHSMAGITVPQFAAVTAPEKVVAVVLLGAVYPSAEVSSAIAKRVEAVEAHGMQAMADTVPFAAVGSKAGSLQHAFIREVLMGTEAVGYVSLCKVIIKAGEDQAAGRGVPYGRITCPALIIVGDEDKSAPPAHSERLLKEVGTKEAEKKLVVLQGIGHWLCVEDGEAVGREIVRFLGELAGGGKKLVAGL